LKILTIVGELARCRARRQGSPGLSPFPVQSKVTKLTYDASTPLLPYSSKVPASAYFDDQDGEGVGNSGTYDENGWPTSIPRHSLPMPKKRSKGLKGLNVDTKYRIAKKEAAKRAA